MVKPSKKKILKDIKMDNFLQKSATAKAASILCKKREWRN